MLKPRAGFLQTNTTQNPTEHASIATATPRSFLPFTEVTVNCKPAECLSGGGRINLLSDRKLNSEVRSMYFLELKPLRLPHCSLSFLSS